MLTVMIVGWAMGATVRQVMPWGQKDHRTGGQNHWELRNVFCLFCFDLYGAVVDLHQRIAGLMQTPPESMKETIQYLRICFAGIPFVVAYNVISSIFRGKVIPKTPMVFVAIACLSILFWIFC